jgi:hypothetical protein
MMIIGCDFHPSWQQISWLDTETGECGEWKLVHAWGDAQRFYKSLAAPVLVGMEATVTANGSLSWSRIWGTRSGSAMRRRSGPVTSASRRRTSGTRTIF